jgi:hypothetical protein
MGFSFEEESSFAQAIKCLSTHTNMTYDPVPREDESVVVEAKSEEGASAPVDPAPKAKTGP